MANERRLDHQQAAQAPHKACREDYTALYLRVPRLFRDLAIARGDGSYDRLLKSYARIDVLVLDDWGLAPVTAPERRDLLEILEDRYGVRSTSVDRTITTDYSNVCLPTHTVDEGVTFAGSTAACAGPTLGRGACSAAASPPVKSSGADPYVDLACSGALGH